MIGIKQLKKDYKKYSRHYEKFQKEIGDLLLNLKEEKSESHGIHDVQERFEGRSIKKLKSILDNAKEEDKYTDIRKLIEIKDIAGVRVTCYCRSDRNILGYYLEGFLMQKGYLSFNLEPKDEEDKEYRAIHIDLAKRISGGKRKEKIYCEIQIRTVLANAWAIQDTEYNYKSRQAEEDSTDLSGAISDILDGCENLWEMVKRKKQAGGNSGSKIKNAK